MTTLFRSDTGHPEHAWEVSQITDGEGAVQPVAGVARAFSNFRRSVWLRPKAAAEAAQYCKNCLLVILKFTVYSLPSCIVKGFFILFVDAGCAQHDLISTCMSSPAFFGFGGGGEAVGPLPALYIKARG
jgi:hypothetical protein